MVRCARCGGIVSLATASGKAGIGSSAPMRTRETMSSAKVLVSEPRTQPARTSARQSRIIGRLPYRSASLVTTASAMAPDSRPEVTSQEAAPGNRPWGLLYLRPYINSVWP